MRYKPSEWGAVAMLMRQSTYCILEAVSKTPKSWSELVESTGLSEPGLLKVLNQLKKEGVIVEVKGKSVTGAKNKKYSLSKQARKLRIYPVAKLLKNRLEMLT